MKSKLEKKIDQISITVIYNTNGNREKIIMLDADGKVMGGFTKDDAKRFSKTVYEERTLDEQYVREFSVYQAAQLLASGASKVLVPWSGSGGRNTIYERIDECVFPFFHGDDGELKTKINLDYKISKYCKF